MLNAKQATEIRRIPEYARTEDQRQLLKEYDDFTDKVAAEAAERRKREAEARAKEKRDAEECSLGWFTEKLVKRVKQAPPRFTLARFGTQLPEYIEKAYACEVALRGKRIEKTAYTKRAIQDAADWLCARPKVGLMLRGGTGTGKTTLLKAINTTLQLTSGKVVKILTAQEIADMARSQPDEFKKLAHTPYLGIDDLGNEPTTVKDYGNDTMPLVELIAKRCEAQLFTIITTNKVVDKEGIDELLATYGKRTYSRLKEMCNTIDYDPDQPDYRQ